MNKTLKGIIGGTVLLAALGGVLVFLKQTDPGTAEESSSADSAVETPLWHAHADDINRIKVEKPDGTSYAANRKMEKVVTTDADGNSVEEDVANYYLEGLEDLPMNVTGIRTLATRAPELASTGTVIEHATADDMKRFGLEEIPALGEDFNPELHNAVMKEPAGEPGKVLEVFQKGYRVKDRIIRYAMVKVAVEE